MHLSLVIPAFDEAQRIGDTLRGVTEYLAQQSYAAEVVVVDDGSTDATLEIARGFKAAARVSVRVVPLSQNCGKGWAVRTGMLDHASGAHRVFYDADASTPIDELEKLWPRFEAGADIVIGSRSLPGSEVEVRQAWYRETMGRTFNLLLRIVGLTGFTDTQCGFKGFTAEATRLVFGRQTVHRFGFDPELLFIAQKHGLRIDEVPVRWINSPHSRVNPLLDSGRMLRDMLLIRVKDLLGRYT